MVPGTPPLHRFAFPPATQASFGCRMSLERPSGLSLTNILMSSGRASSPVTSPTATVRSIQDVERNGAMCHCANMYSSPLL
mmetsp:Transcript_1591/g.5544  ORF Transcript_1591/g.5544 Transcript_1591/m.5544 type:complete len:81 (-) Transcript_1591:1020-1262(-)